MNIASYLTNDNFPKSGSTDIYKLHACVELDASNGGCAVILSGMQIGAGAVVTKDVSAGATVVGNPAHVIQ